MNRAPADRLLERWAAVFQGVFRFLGWLAGSGVPTLGIIVALVVAGYTLLEGPLRAAGDWGHLLGVAVIPPAALILTVSLAATFEYLGRSRRASRAVAWLPLATLRLVGRLLWLAYFAVRHPVRSARFLAGGVPTGWLTLLACGLTAGAVWGWWGLEGWPPAHARRVIATVVPAVALLVPALARVPGRSACFRLGWVSAATAVGMAGWLFIPTADGWSLAGAWLRANTLAAAVRAVPAGDRAGFAADGPARAGLAADFPGVAGTLSRAEEDWGMRTAEAGVAEANAGLGRDGVVARVVLRRLARELADAQRVGVPGSLTRVRRQVLTARLQLEAWAGGMARHGEELRAESATLGVPAPAPSPSADDR